MTSSDVFCALYIAAFVWWHFPIENFQPRSQPVAQMETVYTFLWSEPAVYWAYLKTALNCPRCHKRGLGPLYDHTESNKEEQIWAFLLLKTQANRQARARWSKHHPLFLGCEILFLNSARHGGPQKPHVGLAASLLLSDAKRHSRWPLHNEHTLRLQARP